LTGHVVIGFKPGVYVSESLPMHWVVVHECEVWLVDTQPGGWKRRTVYQGYMSGLTYCSPAIAHGAVLASGIPVKVAQKRGA
jgi:hypothetical protein